MPKNRLRQTTSAGGSPTKRRRVWSKESVIDALKYWQSEKGGVSRIRQADPSLHFTAKRYFGSWPNALAAAGIPATQHRWTAQRVVETIQAKLAEGVSYRVLWSDAAISGAAQNYFGSRSAALSAAGFPATPP